MKNGTPTLPKPQAKTPEARHLGLLALFALLTAVMVQPRSGFEPFIGGFLTACLLLYIFYRDILRYKPQYLEKLNMLILLGLMIVFTLLLSQIFHYILSGFSRGLGFLAGEGVVYGIPIAAGAVLVTLLFDFHTAIVFSFVVSILSGLWLQDSVYPVFSYLGSLIAAFTVMRCKKRSAIIRSGFYVGIANIITTLVLLLFQGQFLTDRTISALLFSASTSITVPAIVSLVLPVLEYAFKVTTDISLLELLDLNQPVMKNLMINAPGTYHHSVIVGNLVESAAEAIGVNPLLARVSAYYHDIGKIKMPEYFVENYTSAVSKHDKLTPHMSSMVITAHVKEGVETAQQYKLPREIIDSIQQHHGTSLITYFYHKARDKDAGSTPPEEDYRYPGPKPQTRVAALVMMADAVEASSRVLSDPTPSRIAALVDKIINHIFLEGQLDECELTLKDISKIKEYFTYILTGILHKRVDYPGFDFSSEPSRTGREQERGMAGEAFASQSTDGHTFNQPAKTPKDKYQKDKERLTLAAQKVQSHKS